MNIGVLSLYKKILTLHRLKLQAEKRALGDAYVKKEFRDHRKAKPEFFKQFMFEWQKYANDLENVKTIGRDLPSKIVSELNPEQRQLLLKLEREARSLKQKR